MYRIQCNRHYTTQFHTVPSQTRLVYSTSTVQHRTTQNSSVRCSAAQYTTLHYCAAEHSTALVHYSTPKYGIVQHRAAHSTTMHPHHTTPHMLQSIPFHYIALHCIRFRPIPWHSLDLSGFILCVSLFLQHPTI